MSSAALLVAYAVAVGTWGAAGLRDARWTRRAPRLAIAAWQALATSVLFSIVSAGVSLAISLGHVRADIARFLDLCADNLAYAYATPGGAIVSAAGLVTAGLLVARITWCALRAAHQDRRTRSERIAMLDMVGEHGLVPGAVVLEHDEPYAFCVGGRQHRIAVTSGLLARLSPEETRAVLAHEEAHLCQRHHVALLACQALFTTLAPAFPTFRGAMTQVRLYAELAADDSARLQVGAASLHSALAALTYRRAPAGTLAASATDVLTRLQRLGDQEHGMAPTASALTATTIAGALLVPLMLIAAPALAVAWEGICVLTWAP